MAKRARPSGNKRQKERVRQERRQTKIERRAQREVERQERPNVVVGEDPDIAGILPGPQHSPANRRED
jgi:hypothetical protein